MCNSKRMQPCPSHHTNDIRCKLYDLELLCKLKLLKILILTQQQFWNWIFNRIIQLMYVLHSPMKFLSFSWTLTVSIKVRKETQYLRRTGRDKLWEWCHRADGGPDRRISQKTAGRKLVVMITYLASSWEEYRLRFESTQEEEITYVNKTPLFKTAYQHQVVN